VNQARPRPRWAAVCAGLASLGCCGLFGQENSKTAPADGIENRPPEIRSQWVANPLGSDRVVLVLSGLPASLLRTLAKEDADTPEAREWLSVYTDFGSVAANVGLPPMLGKYEIHERTNLVFRPEFPLQPGMSYRAILRMPASDAGESDSRRLLSFAYRHPKDEESAPTHVRQIHPSADVLPENLLKFYIQFSGAMSRGNVYDYIRLLDGEGSVIDLPFLELDEELWNPAMTRLTLFIDPGRIKRGVKPLEDIGPALEAGGRYTLAIDRAWRDAGNRPLAETFRKEFQVGPPDRQPLDPDDWSMQSPAPNSTEALTVSFPESLDHALASRLIQVVDEKGKLLEGDVELEDQDRRWRFRPAQSWRKGSYRVVVAKIIEDLAGNNIGKPFEVESDEPVPKDLASGTVSLAFEIE
jgi:hypothetical protein